MSRKTGRNRRIQLYDRGNRACPLCMTGFTRDQASAGRSVTLEHVPPKGLGGQARCLTCRRCNARAGDTIDQVAAMTKRDRFPVTVDILGKRDTFMLTREGTPLTPPLAGFSSRDWEMLHNSPSRQFTMSVKIPNAGVVAASALRAAHLAVFSLLGPAGYDYVRGSALAPVRRLIAGPLREGIAKYVDTAPQETPDRDILLITQPVPCWMVKVEGQLVTLPLEAHSQTSTPLWDWHRRTGRNGARLVAPASWAFHTFGTLHAVPVHLAGADKSGSLIGLEITGNLPHGQSLQGACIRHAGESAVLLSADPVG